MRVERIRQKRTYPVTGPVLPPFCPPPTQEHNPLPPSQHPCTTLCLLCLCQQLGVQMQNRRSSTYLPDSAIHSHGATNILQRPALAECSGEVFPQAVKNPILSIPLCNWCGQAKNRHTITGRCVSGNFRGKRGLNPLTLLNASCSTMGLLGHEQAKMLV